MGGPLHLKSLLVHLADEGERAGKLYLELRDKLLRFFIWSRCPFPDELADEVLDRTARRLDEGEEVVNLHSFVFGVARLVRREALETHARRESKHREMAAASLSTTQGEPHDSAALCLEKCLGKLPPEARALILDYYAGEARDRNRVRLAAQLNISSHALRNRALRLRKTLTACVATCMQKDRR